ncbi:MAG: SDR family NAD(P)-dependent oxidoreductase [Myxococcota bacterium]|nr:SDR family NAD(P)-dependent oxidoreductase [Myxococcota bacterium]
MRRAGQEPPTPGGTTVITGGAGFIGANLAHRIAGGGGDVVLFDNLARQNVQLNAQWLREQHGRRVQLVTGDVRDETAVRKVIARADRVFHFAAQVAVTSSVVDPALDFAVNAQGTFHVLEAVRAQDREIPLLFTSTNKVYGALPDVALQLRDRRWAPDDPAIASSGIGEQRPLDFHSPYGCSKGTADQYVFDWSRSYGLPTVVFRMSCIYGPRQFGTEDQGWVAHFLIRALRGERIVLYGDGMQVRDVLFVDDLVDGFCGALDQLDHARGHAFNVGGGPDNTVSLIELLDLARELTGARVDVTHAPVRVGDQRWYVSDPRKLEAAIGWRPRTGVRRGVERLVQWLRDPSRRAPALRPSIARAAE